MACGLFGSVTEKKMDEERGQEELEEKKGEKRLWSIRLKGKVASTFYVINVEIANYTL